jgi:hypothetical protein
MTEETRVKSIFVCAATMLFLSAYALAGTLKTFDAPDATQTYARGISGSNIVGYYADTSGKEHGFIYDGTNWTILNRPGAIGTRAMGIDGGHIVGNFYDNQGEHTFLYDGTNWTTISENLAPPEPYGISGDNIVGTTSVPVGSDMAFIYNIPTETCTFIHSPLGWTEAYGIDGDNIVGVAINAMENPIHNRGFLYDGSTWTILDAPGSTWTEAYGIDGSNVVGLYRSGTHYYNFLYDGSTWTTLDFGGIAYDIDGSSIVGSINVGKYSGTYGFVYTIPEPASLLLFAISGLALRSKAKSPLESQRDSEDLVPGILRIPRGPKGA